MKQPRCAGVLGLAATARQSKTLQKEYHTRERAIGEKKLRADKENEESDGSEEKRDEQGLRCRSSSCARVRSAAKPLSCALHPNFSQPSPCFTSSPILAFYLFFALAWLLSLVLFLPPHCTQHTNPARGRRSQPSAGNTCVAEGILVPADDGGCYSRAQHADSFVSYFCWLDYHGGGDPRAANARNLSCHTPYGS